MTTRCRPYADADLPRLQAALAGWRREAGPCGYCHVGDLAFRIYEELRGRRPVGELVQVWEDGGAVAGVAICPRFGWAFDVFVSPALGHFEPVGTRRAFRRRGLGRALLLQGLRELRRLGMETATVQHDAANLAARDLYRGLGFERRFETFGYRRAEAGA